MKTIRIAVIVDGFNVYHSIHELIKYQDYPADIKWLDLRSLSDSFLHQIQIAGRKEVVSVDYFSALAYHKAVDNPFHVDRHNEYIRVLKKQKVDCHIHRFKKKHKDCKICGKKFKMHEEKETDVAIATALLKVFIEDAADVAVLVTGDTDISPAVKAVFELYPAASVWFAFPYRRRNKELTTLVETRGGAFKINPKAYLTHRLPNPFICKRGKEHSMPEEWAPARPPEETADLTVEPPVTE